MGFQPVYSSEHMAALGVFGLLQLFAFANYVRSLIEPAQFQALLRLLLLVVLGGVGAAFVVSTATGYVAPWTGRFYSLLDPTYAKANIPIIASVSEHQPTTWTSFFFDLHICVVFSPVGLYFLFKDVTDAKIFTIIYGTVAWYFAGVMVRAARAREGAGGGGRTGQQERRWRLQTRCRQTATSAPRPRAVDARRQLT